ncbi:dTDP-4-amino-4,6-dideoxygalactose transaminase [Aliivibrio fischeri]|uniref:dTDP-4-amino-4,6-dideoxygalactose transaminase n=1 Tax=Aliivibrio fischeri TaxID=668 RepID=A0A510UKE8_ALIFS|nr:dTDP-4-amino-4,6-dideoxygalactose transaminase [Aliivibrio fischeri]MUL16617.1 dTDP-4-amino-4,6-dideoxygalactose transaminase [Aliivibrio fischeri]GEK15077.1 dTDP-4-amino-4,6-dideoxygalactose transaminase [Aliivibrio fischeri]
MNKIPFNLPLVIGNELSFIEEALKNKELIGDGYYSKRCQEWFKDNLGLAYSFMVPNCTQALEMAAILLNIENGDEVIMPSYTFVSTANAFVLRGAKIRFIDVNPETMNIDDGLIESAITDKTKAIVVVHYAGISCNMNNVIAIAKKNNIKVVEDAAQALGSKYNSKSLGSFGDIACFSFHGTKNYTSGGEGGLVVINNPELLERAEIIREKGTNRSKFYRGQVDKYNWVDLGSSYLPSEIQSSYLLAQLENFDLINKKRNEIWNKYYSRLTGVLHLELMNIPRENESNGHLFYVKLKDESERSDIIKHLNEYGISSAFHYVPLHSSQAGKKYSDFIGADKYTTVDSERLLRLPLYYDLTIEQVDYICDSLIKFWSGNV